MSQYGRARFIAWHLGVLLVGSVLIGTALYLLWPSTAVANGVFASWLLLATVALVMLALRSPRLSMRTALWSGLSALLLMFSVYALAIVVLLSNANFC